VPPDKVDVNVHPTKAEVRFQENSLIYSLVRSAVKNRLLKENLVPRIAVPAGVEYGTVPSSEFSNSFPQAHLPSRQEEVRRHASAPVRPGLFSSPTPQISAGLAYPLPTGTLSPRCEAAEQAIAPWEQPVFVATPETSRTPDLPPPREHLPQPPLETSPNEGEPSARQHPEIPGAPVLPDGAPAVPRAPTPADWNSAFGSGRIAMQIQDSYLVLETAEGMLVIDQHALHERILFEQLRRRVRDGRLEVQRLLIPEPIDLPAEQAALVLEAADSLKELGLEVSEFGGNTVLLSSYPTLLGRKSPHEIFQGVVDYLLTKERPPTKEAMLHLLMATMACKAAVKAGDRLTPEEIAHLLHLRQLAEDSHHCPHGRPTSLLFSRQELDKQFRRT
jgi:DNA mismatch repair protein MutL